MRKIEEWMNSIDWNLLFNLSLNIAITILLVIIGYMILF